MARRQLPAAMSDALVHLVRALVDAHGQAGTARLLEVTQTHVSELVRGKSQPGGHAIAMLARHYPDAVAAALGLSRPVGPATPQTARRYPHVEDAIAIRGRWSRDTVDRLRGIALCWPRDKSVGVWIDMGDELAAELAATPPEALPPGFSVVTDDD